MKRFVISALAAAAAAALISIVARAAGLPACDPDNGGLKLPDGFCATVVADDVGHARHLVVAPNGDAFVAVGNSRLVRGGVVALRDTDGDGKFDKGEKFGDNGGNGIALRNGYLYLATTTSVPRDKK